MNTSLSRIDWIDFARGIGILFVMLGHTRIPYLPEYFVYAFHMPFFFILSGLCFSVKDNETFRTFFIKKAKTRVIPYFFISFIWIIWDVFTALFHHTFNITFLLKDVATYVLQRHFHPIWFLTCLFLSEMIFYVIERIIKKLNSPQKIYIGVIILFFIASYVYSKYIKIWLPWCADLTLTAVPYMILGYILKNALKSHFNNHATNLLLFTLLICISVVANGFNINMSNIIKTDFIYNQFGNYLLYTLSSITGSIAIICLSKVLKKNRIINYIGENSILIFTLHQIAFTTFDKAYSFIPVKSEAIEIYLWIVYIIASLFALFLFNEIICRTPLRILIGKKA